MVKKKQSVDTYISSDNRSPSTAVIPQIMSTANSITPMSIHSKEKFTPVGIKYQSKTKSVDRRTPVFENIILYRSNENLVSDIDHHQSLSFREKSTDPMTSQTQHQILLDSPASPHNHKSVYIQIFSR
jgi:hypothetical protein